MNLIQIIDAVDRLDHADRKRLMSHLVLKRLREKEEYRSELSRRLDDTSPGAWIPLSELESRLKQS